MRSNLALSLTIVLITNTSYAGDYPMASCKAWNGTITGARNLGSTMAEMYGRVTESDILEYCARQVAANDVSKCMKENEIRVQTAKSHTIANCRENTIIFTYSDALNSYVTKANFSVKPQNLSCAGGLLPLIKQYKYLCLNSYNSKNMASW